MDDKCLIFHTNNGQRVEVKQEINGDGLWLTLDGRIRTAECYERKRIGDVLVIFYKLDSVYIN